MLPEFRAAPSMRPQRRDQLFISSCAQGQLSSSALSPPANQNTCLPPISITAVPDGASSCALLHAVELCGGTPSRKRPEPAGSIRRHAGGEASRPGSAGQRLPDDLHQQQRTLPIRCSRRATLRTSDWLNTAQTATTMAGLQLTAEQTAGAAARQISDQLSRQSRCLDTVSNDGFLPFAASALLSAVAGRAWTPI